MTFGRISLGCAASLVTIAVACAAQPAAAYAGEQRFSFDMKSRELGPALQEFGQVTRKQVAFSASAVRGRKVSPLRGEFTAEEALSRILKDTGFVSEQRGSGVILVKPARLEDAVSAEPTPAGVIDGQSEILVTARKRTEDVLKTPVAVSVLTSEAVAKRGITNLNDIAANTPGLNINNNAAGRNDRSFQQVIIRGFTPSQPLNATAALFIDGTPVASSTAFSALSDPERIEVLKGPQAAYFGRNTFAGAVNFVNKAPTEELSGSVSATLGTRENYRLHGDLSGSLVEDLLGFRVNLNRFSKAGSWRNQATGETLGDQQTTSGTAMLVATPSPNLTLKALGLLSRDKDGPSAQGLISAYTLRGANGSVVVPGQSNCTLSGVSSLGAPVSNPFICGVTSDLAFGPSQNTLEDTYIRNFLSIPRGRVVSPKDGVKGYGLVRKYYHLHFIADWEIPDTGLTLSSLTAYNNERYSQLSDGDNYDGTLIPNATTAPAGSRSYFDQAYLIERVLRDFSQEGRLSYDDGGPFTGTIGASYLNAFMQNSLGGGNGALGTVTFSNTDGATRNRTFGLFFGTNYAITPELSLSLEGRYQIDKLAAYAGPNGFTTSSSVFVPAGTYSPGQKLIGRTYENFLPRAIVQYQFSPSLMAYASYSKGVNPAAFNVGILSFALPLQRAAAAAGMRVLVNPEKVTNYEIGLKGRAFDNRLAFALATYYAPWRNQINSLTITENDPVTNSIQIVRAASNTGNVDMKGIELEGTYNLFDALDINFSGAINDSSINDYQNGQVIQLTGITDFDGKENPQTSKYSASIGAQYNGKLADGAWFLRGDLNYKSGLYSDAANTVRTPHLTLVNARTGLDFDSFSISAWVRNVFDNKTFTSIANASVQTPNSAYSTYLSALIVGLPERRTFGLDAAYRF